MNEPLEALTPGPSAEDDKALWATLASATDAAGFCRAWLDLLCAGIPGAAAGLVLLESDAHVFAPAAIWPRGPRDLTLLREIAEQVLHSGEAVIEPDDGKAGHSRIAYPISAGTQLCGVIALAIKSPSPALLQATVRKLHWGVGWIVSMVWRHRADVAAERTESAAAAMDLLAVVQEHDRLDSAAIALCNTIATRLDAARVSLGLVRDRAVKLAAMSHGAWFRKRSDVSELIEAAMEESLDQGAPIRLPDPEASHIILQHDRLLAKATRGAVMTVPMLDRGVIIGLLTLERAADARPFAREDQLFLDAAAGLIGPAIALRQREERWLAGRIRSQTVGLTRALFGPHRPLAKAIGIGAVILFLFLLLPFAQFRVSADAALQGSIQRVAAAPFAGFIAGSNARAGDVVQAGQLLATMDDRELKLDQARWSGEVAALDRRYREALALHKRAEMNLYGAQLGQARAQLALTNYKLARTRIAAPIAGVVVTGDLSQLVGTPVEEGKALFEVAPLDDFRVVLRVDEADIRYVRAGQTGRFAPQGLAGGTIDFRITKLTSVTSAEDGKNLFRVEAALDKESAGALRPGMEGVAKIDIDRRSRLWIWTRALRDWMTLFFWRWFP